jgi:hypothetical protein
MYSEEENGVILFRRSAVRSQKQQRVLLPQNGDSATFTHDTAASGNQHMAASQYIARSQLQ